jgi:hypothetical protein
MNLATILLRTIPVAQQAKKDGTNGSLFVPGGQ